MLQKYFKKRYNVNEVNNHKREFEGVIKMTKVTSKALASSLVILTALGLAGCANSAAAPTTSKTTTTNAKVVKQASTKTAKKVNTAKSVSPQATATTTDNQATNPDQQANTSQPVSNHNNDQQVLTNFVKTSGVQQDGNHYYVNKNNDNSYQIEVRNNEGGDPNIAHLTGTYQYDPTTNQLQEMNPVTGNYEN
jgi:hypothetical protein